MKNVSIYKCCQCKKEFTRYACSVRNPNKTCCSKQCLNELLSTSLLQKNNPNYRHGKQCAGSVSLCGCGKEKDFRAKQCIDCRLVRLSKRDVILASKLSDSLLGLAKRLNTSRASVTRLIRKWGINVSHFKPARNRVIPISQFFVLKEISRTTVKRRLLKEKMLPYVCDLCGQPPVHNGKVLVLELHHKNGNRADNRVENLQILCPNCHSQTSTHKGKNKNYYLKGELSAKNQH